jgi:hypothetical protein
MRVREGGESLARMLCLSLLWLLAVEPAAASLGGPDLCEALGWDRATKEAYFAIHHVGDSGLPPTVVRLRLDGPDTVGCQPLAWSKGAGDSTYQANRRQLTRKLTPLVEYQWTTMPSLAQVVSRDSLARAGDGRYTRYRARAFFAGHEGTVEAITYVDPSVRMIRAYHVPEVGVMIGVFSFLGIPYEGGYEVQVPALVPSKRGSRIVLQGFRE